VNSSNPAVPVERISVGASGVRLRMLEAAGDPVERLVVLAARHAFAVIHYRRDFVDTGGLLSYGPSFAGAFRQAFMPGGS
jgi:hypothetical protein